MTMQTTKTADEQSWLAEWMGRIATRITENVKIKGHEVSAKGLKGPTVIVTIKGAEGDIEAAKDAREQLDTILKAAITDELKNYKGFSHRVMSANRGEDLQMTCEIMFP